MTGGPFAPAKGLVAGYWLIRAKSKQAAVEWAKRVPFEAGESGAYSGGIGQIEVRQAFELEDFPVSEHESGWREAEAGFQAQAASGGGAAKHLKRSSFSAGPTRTRRRASCRARSSLAAMGVYNEELTNAGVLLAGEGLKPSSAGRRGCYASSGKHAVVDGPFAESNGLIAGFTLIQAKSLEEALDWVKRWPAIDAESEAELEVRQVFGADEFAAEFTPELAAADEFQRQLIASQQWPPEY